MSVRVLVLIASASLVTGWAVIATMTRSITPVEAAPPLALGLVLALSLIRAHALGLTVGGVS